MKFDNPVLLSEIATLIEAEIVGDKNLQASGINEIHKVAKGDLVFVDHPKYYSSCLASAASFIIINSHTDIPEGKALLICADPFEAYQKIVRHYRPFSPATEMISPDIEVGKGTVIMPGVFIGRHCSIGKNCTIYPNVTILDYCKIGNGVIIQSGSVIGSDAFYYNKKVNREIHYNKMLSCGNVVIENGVEIGAACTIDRGVSNETRIGAGTKIDNMVHIGHDTIIGKNCLLAAQVGIAGATTIEDNVILWGQVGVTKTITIGEGAIVQAQSGVAGGLRGGKTYFGSPAREAREKLKEQAWLKRIPEMWEKLKSNN